MTTKILFTLLTLSQAAVAVQCPPEFSDRSRMPACSGTNKPQILSDNYPVGAVVVSIPEFRGRDQSKAKPMQQTYDFLVSMAQNQNPMPLIVLPVKQEEYDELVRRLSEAPIPATQKAAIIKRMAHAPVQQSYTWQQDYFQSTVGPGGQVLLRPNTGYLAERGVPEHFDAISKVLAACGVKVGERIDAGLTDNVGGMSGGNIEALPDGTCLIGDDSFASSKDTAASYNRFVTNLCGSPDNNINIPTHWLTVGHTDEILKVLPNANAKDPKCGFSVALASPNLAVDLLKKNPNDPFFANTNLPPTYQSPSDALTVRRSINGALQEVCTKLEKKRYINFDDKAPGEGGDEDGGTKTFFRILPQWMQFAAQQFFGVSNALEIPDDTLPDTLPEVIDDQPAAFFENKSIDEAEEDGRVILKDLGSGSIDAAEKKPAAESSVTCESASNKDIARLYEEDSKFIKINAYVEDQMQMAEEDLRKKLDTAYPGCNIAIERFPQLFNAQISPDGFVYSADSINPNPTNGVIMGSQAYIPDQNNKAFEKYTKDLLAKKGLSAHFVNTFDFAHSMNGNLHCSTQTINLCR